LQYIETSALFQSLYRCNQYRPKMVNNSVTNFQELMDQWDLFYQKSLPLVSAFCQKRYKNPVRSIKCMERAFLKLSFEYHNLYEEEHLAIMARLFDILDEIQPSLSEKENIHNNAFILLSQYYYPN